MGIFKKSVNKEEKIPKLPSLPTMQGNRPQNLEQQNQYYDQSLEEPNPLPEYPNSNIGSEMNQNTVKEAVTDQPQEYDESGQYDNYEQGSYEQEPITQEYDESEQYDNYEQEPIQQYEEPQEQTPMQTVPAIRKQKSTTRNEPLYIQLDKFEHTIASFDQIKLQISEIEALLKHIKETRKKEEENLSNWEAEIEQIRAKLEKIDKDIFSQV